MMDHTSDPKCTALVNDNFESQRAAFPPGSILRGTQPRRRRRLPPSTLHLLSAPCRLNPQHYIVYTHRSYY